jgi:6-phosphogluconolactonase
MNNRIQIYNTPIDAARAVAEIILLKAKEKNKQSLALNIALSGGSTPTLLFQLLANEYATSIPWHIVRLFWVDERCVPPTNSESNFGVVYDNLLVHVSINENNVFRMQGENNPQKEADRYNTLLEKELPIKNGFPQFDLVLLGMGDDGHTASIFPNNMELLNAQLPVQVAVHPTSGQHRITLTGKTIANANLVIFLITGQSKRQVLRQIIEDDSNSHLYPAYHFSKLSVTEFILDTDAALEINN